MKIFSLLLLFCSFNAYAQTCPPVMKDSRFGKYMVDNKPMPTAWTLIKEQAPVVWVGKTPYTQLVSVNSPHPIDVKFLALVHPCFTRDAISCGFPGGRISLANETRLVSMGKCADPNYRDPEFRDPNFCAPEFYDGMTVRFVNGGQGGDINSLSFRLEGIKKYSETITPVCIYGAN